MSQKEFTAYVISHLLKRFPQFRKVGTSASDDTSTIACPSSHANLMLWVSTENREITVGLTGNTAAADWHTHMSQVGAATPDEEMQAAVQLLSGILTDQEVIVYSSLLGYFLPADIADIYDYQQPAEIISVFRWSDL
ncbi:hypothetical protein [Hymenobacter metallicola]|uniref:Uncharacterized protein n=1 Tax=Hymenobacter metallicola TaxID=2563114 RepID=A0A4Z0Q050_9BACT|nr:hypothetical protein [Hymenobacter metallicola]TGE23410.1 hypothetical protein E5K02_19640 [Hymenobacter metallicola]